jgi:hypothetical protein
MKFNPDFAVGFIIESGKAKKIGGYILGKSIAGYFGSFQYSGVYSYLTEQKVNCTHQLSVIFYQRTF